MSLVLCLSHKWKPGLRIQVSEIEDNDLRPYACQVKNEQLSLHASMKLKNAISHYALVSSRANNSVKDEQLPLSIKAEHTTRQHEQKGRIQVDTLGAAAMHDLHVIQGPNVTRDAREKIAFFAFHAFVVEDSRFQQNRVRAKL